MKVELELEHIKEVVEDWIADHFGHLPHKHVIESQDNLISALVDKHNEVKDNSDSTILGS